MIAILSDIHGNLAALKAVLKDIEDKGIEEIVCLGDVVGYGPQSPECLLLMEDAMPRFTLMGNHELAMIEGAENFNPRARQAIEWTAKQVLDGDYDDKTREERIKYFSELPRTVEDGCIVYAHGSPRKPVTEYVTPAMAKKRAKLKDLFTHFDNICVVGHTHVPGIITLEEGFQSPDDIDNFFVFGDEKTIVNSGSVGQPRDNDPRACYATLDDEVIVWRRVEYNVKATAKRIQKIPELHDQLARRLIKGT